MDLPSTVWGATYLEIYRNRCKQKSNAHSGKRGKCAHRSTGDISCGRDISHLDGLRNKRCLGDQDQCKEKDLCEGEIKTSGSSLDMIDTDKNQGSSRIRSIDSRETDRGNNAGSIIVSDCDNNAARGWIDRGGALDNSGISGQSASSSGSNNNSYRNIHKRAKSKNLGTSKKSLAESNSSANRKSTFNLGNNWSETTGNVNNDDKLSLCNGRIGNGLKDENNNALTTGTNVEKSSKFENNSNEFVSDGNNENSCKVENSICTNENNYFNGRNIFNCKNGDSSVHTCNTKWYKRENKNTFTGLNNFIKPNKSRKKSTISKVKLVIAKKRQFSKYGKHKISIDCSDENSCIEAQDKEPNTQFSQDRPCTALVGHHLMDEEDRTYSISRAEVCHGEAQRNCNSVSSRTIDKFMSTSIRGLGIMPHMDQTRAKGEDGKCDLKKSVNTMPSESNFSNNLTSENAKMLSLSYVCSTKPDRHMFEPQGTATTRQTRTRNQDSTHSNNTLPAIAITGHPKEDVSPKTHSAVCPKTYELHRRQECVKDRESLAIYKARPSISNTSSSSKMDTDFIEHKKGNLKSDSTPTDHGDKKRAKSFPITSQNFEKTTERTRILEFLKSNTSMYNPVMAPVYQEKMKKDAECIVEAMSNLDLRSSMNVGQVIRSSFKRPSSRQLLPSHSLSRLGHSQISSNELSYVPLLEKDPQKAQSKEFSKAPKFEISSEPYNATSKEAAELKVKVERWRSVLKTSSVEEITKDLNNFTAMLVPMPHSKNRQLEKERLVSKTKTTATRYMNDDLDTNQLARIHMAQDCHLAFTKARIPTLRRSPAHIKWHVRDKLPPLGAISGNRSTLRKIHETASLTASASPKLSATNTSYFTVLRRRASSKRALSDRGTVRIDQHNIGTPRFYHWAPFDKCLVHLVHQLVLETFRQPLPHQSPVPPQRRLSKQRNQSLIRGSSLNIHERNSSMVRFLNNNEDKALNTMIQKKKSSGSGPTDLIKFTSKE
ncbi:hypothetical protein PoB_002118900 [Plakobranchus ocellatus]|uniref:Uncharacterized protein n=1 Tax=Plakobranchus ocellatus TaxID=259542 RepID=A0AAV3ZJZ6_9GAST|nr:hypothetical protein PoB_002118900 [Plakobranchus ocellatus]